MSALNQPMPARNIGSRPHGRPLNEGIKQSLYFDRELLAEIEREAKRMDRSHSYVLRVAWRLARDEVRCFPPAKFPREGRRFGDGCGGE